MRQQIRALRNCGALLYQRKTPQYFQVIAPIFCSESEPREKDRMSGAAEPTPKTAVRGGAAGEVLAVFLRLGLTSFGGPIAHLGYFHEEFVARRRWLDEKTFVDLVALSQFLPGPASSKVGIAIGLSRAGYLGALAAWAGFTLPSALVLVLFGYGVASFGDALRSGWLHGFSWWPPSRSWRRPDPVPHSRSPPISAP